MLPERRIIYDLGNLGLSLPSRDEKYIIVQYTKIPKIFDPPYNTLRKKAVNSKFMLQLN